MVSVIGNSRTRAIKTGLAILVLAVSFLILTMAPMRLDDWAWGSSLGIDRLTQCFAGYNGRYAGDVAVIILTRLPAPLRALFELAVLLGIAYNSYLIVGKSKMALAVGLCLFMLIPLQIATQTLTWASGFANFTISLLLILYQIRVVLEVDRGAHLNAIRTICFLAITIVGQLFLETATIYVLCLSLFFFVRSCKRQSYGRLFFGLMLLCAVVGAAIMFSNSAYTSAAVNNGETYKSISLLDGGILASTKRWFKAFSTGIVPYWLANCAPACIALSSLSSLLALFSKKPGHIIAFLFGIVFTAAALYFCIDSNWYTCIPKGNYIKGCFYLAVFVFFVVTAVLFAKDEDRETLLVLLVSQFFLVGPLLFVNPIGPRCFLAPYAFWCLTVGLLLKQVLKKAFRNKENGGEMAPESLVSLVPYVFVLVCVVFSAISQSFSWHVYDLRQDAIDHAISSSADKVILPEVPHSSEYCYGANVSNSNGYWLTNYKRYYGIANDTELVFCSYDDYRPNEID